MMNLWARIIRAEIEGPPLAARSWTPVEADLISIGIAHRGGSENIEVSYEHQFEGGKFSSDQRNGEVQEQRINLGATGDES